MAKKTIIKKWAEDTHNKYELSEEQVKTGIVRLGNIVSNQLNAVANRADTMIDLLQRCSAWNADKTYQQGDLCMVSVYYKRPSDTQHKYYIMFLLSTINDNTEIPLINNGAVSFTRNDDLTTPCFTITANSEIILSNFVNGTGWVFADSTCGDLTNCVNLSVSDLAHFKGNTSFDGNVVANSNINLAGNLTTQGHLELAGTANFNNSVTLNGLVNTATTPANTAYENEVATAKWVRDYIQNNMSNVRQNVRVNIEKDIKFLSNLEGQKIIINTHREFFTGVCSFAWELKLSNGDIYKSKKELDLDSWKNIDITDTQYEDMFWIFGVNNSNAIADNILKSDTYNMYLGTYNDVDFEYFLNFLFKNGDDNMIIEILPFSNFIDDVTGQFTMIFF